MTKERISGSRRRHDNDDGYDDEFDGQDKVTVRIPVEVGKGYWLYSTVDGVIIP